MQQVFLQRTVTAAARLSVIAMLCVLPAAAAEPGIWGELNVPVFRSDGVLATATAEFRSDEVFPRNTFLGRYSASARFPFSHGWSFRAGYSSFLRGNDLVRLGWQKTLSGGISYPLGTAKLIGSTIYEHHWLPADRGERHRMRQRFEFTWPLKIASPWAYEDLTVQDGRGLFRTRTRAGLGFELARGWQLRTGYQFQALQRGSSTAWTPRHAVILSLRLPTLFDRRAKRKQQKQAPEPEQPADQLDED